MNTKDDMDQYLQNNLSIDSLKSQLENKNSEFYFVTLGEGEIGYLKLNFGEAQTVKVEGNGFEIERIYVLGEYQGMKVGKFLLESVIEILCKKITLKSSL